LQVFKENTEMSRVAIQKVSDGKKDLPIFDEIAKRFEAVRRRAFDLFEKRGRQFGDDLKDWLKAERELLGRPPAELAEKDGAYEMQIALPGFEAKEVEVTATPAEIIVHAATEEEKETKRGTVLWTGFSSNDVYQRFEVPNLIDVDQVTATLEKGLLRIHAPQMVKASSQAA
jgi:HSP20 family protein